MADWPNDLAIGPLRGMASSMGEESILSDVCFFTRQLSVSSAAWPAANRAIYIPFHLESTMTAFQMGWWNQATLSGNVDAGIYDWNRNKLVSTGSTVQAGASTIQTVDIADTVLTPGTYFLALAASSATATFMRVGPQFQLLQISGVMIQDTALPLPSTATFATPGNSFLPLVFASAKSVI